MNYRDVLYREVMPVIEKPSRYLGTEMNSTHKNLDEVELRVALVFPDLYDLGLGNLGLLILYSILNDLPYVWAERAYAPAPDMEKALRERGIPMFVNESKDSLADMDVIGFTLQTELNYTSILNMIDLAGLPVRWSDRDENAPLICAGGPAVFNPEPLAPFIDFFVIGDGEDAVVEMAETLRPLRGRPRREKLEALAKLEGFYVPALYPFETLPDGRILPKEDAPKIKKRLVKDLDGAKFPTNYIVPYTQQVHDRVGLEVLRGCTHGCRFCQAGMVTRPVRERNMENIDQLMERTLQNTGYEEVSLVSLSTCDYSKVRTMVSMAEKRAALDNASVSLPSLRLGSFSVELADMVAGVRRSGLTFAPEAASPRMRAIINKWIPDEDLLEMASQAFRRGWQHVKCYFMIGLPTERDEDIEAIVDLCVRTLNVGKQIKPRARVNLGVSTFVPKPFTPFQWAEQIGLEETERRQQILDAGFKRYSAIKFGRHHAESTFIEGLITRADRRGADLIEAAWRRGARHESNGEWLNFRAWAEAIEEIGYDLPGAFRERGLDERLPWDHIDVLIPKEWFQQDWQRAMELKHAADCRQGKCHLCGVIRRERDLCRHMLKNQKAGRIEEADWQRPPRTERVEPEAVQRLRFRIGRTGEVRFLSHLELMNAWVRALRRARTPLSYTQGFHAHPRISFATAPPVGEESEGDYMDVILKERVEPREMLAKLSATLPIGLGAFDVEEVPLRAPSVMSIASGFVYRLEFDGNACQVSSKIDEIMETDEVCVERKAKVKNSGRRVAQQSTNIRPWIAELALSDADGDRLTVAFTTHIINGRSARPREILALLGIDPAAARVIKRDTLLGDRAATVST